MHVVHKRYLPLSDQFASSVTPLRWYLLVVEFCGPKEELSSFVKITNVTLTKKTKKKQRVKFTRVKLKVRIVDCICVKTSVALLAPHNPVEFVTLGLRFNTSWIVWPKRKKTQNPRYTLFQVCFISIDNWLNICCFWGEWLRLKL